MNNEQLTVVRTRKALNSLQYEPNGKNIVGLSTSQKSNIITNPKQVLFDTNDKQSKLKKRNSISLPDINLLAEFKEPNLLNKSATSTPNKKGLKKISASKSNISIISEEKENPGYLNKLGKMKNIEARISNKQAARKSTKQIKQESKEISIQCNISEEDMVFSDSVKGTDYWRLIAHKRQNALIQTKIENKNLHQNVEVLNEKNEALRESITELLELIDQYKEIQKTALEAEEMEQEDSGYDLTN